MANWHRSRSGDYFVNSLTFTRQLRTRARYVRTFRTARYASYVRIYVEGLASVQAFLNNRRPNALITHLPVTTLIDATSTR